MGLFDNLSPVGHKILVGLMIASFLGLCIAMCVAPPPVQADSNAELDISLADSSWVLASTALLLIMTPGVAFFYGGMVQHKNVVSTIMQSILPLSIIPMLWCFLGFSLAYGNDAGYPGFIGNPSTYGLMYNVGVTPVADLAPRLPFMLFFVFEMMFAVMTPALIIGSVADRVNFSSLCVFVSLWHLVVYCPIAHMVWHPDGIIRSWGVLDFAGGTVVHMSAGFAALVCAWYLGPAESTSGGSSTPERQGPTSVPSVVLGTSLLWFGWFGFNAGSALSAGPLAALALINTNMAAAASMITWMLMDQLKGLKLRATGLCFGAIVGLVAITPAAGYVNVGGAAIIGIMAAIIGSVVQTLMHVYGRQLVDDALDVFACHGIGGSVGMICTSLFSTTSVNVQGANGAFYGNPMLLAKTLLVLVIIVPWFFLFTFGCLWITDQLVTLRVTSAEERIGLDLAKHGQKASAIHINVSANGAFEPQQGTKGSRSSIDRILNVVRDFHLNIGS